ncbi:phosphoenolpyruvate--protein phosphotransferase [Faecalicatena contorta]|uniref:phosphoenolpyruvate--protein phosphotransferase n=1 Tax=Faecalicatena contorta TaxID=39482 RepID=UPI001F4552EF|nr:phosphoenolpyruvate--protein phosphotransferase [Faecalicatena contorta]MCF2555444.1 phosphoenolpyruvate--protein phosphotransferase [Faecalicatena contorta]MCF2679842.1 phosphoenolpyruvate--protein phosphotransferase [Faecalicatena contorta]
MKKISVSQTASKGYAIGPVYLVERRELIIERKKVAAEEIELEVERYNTALATAKAQLEKLAADSDIFEAYVQLVQDEALIQGITAKIQSGCNAESAVEDTIDEFVMIFDSMDDVYMKERAADLKDVKKRLQYALQGIEENPFQEMEEPAIIVAEELTPSDTANMDFSKVLGFLTEVGGVTSHVSIIAKGRGIPCLTGVKDICAEVKSGMMTAMDAGTGEVYLEPDDETIEEFTKKKSQFEEQEKMMEEESKNPSVTKDGHKFMLCANVGNIDDIKDALGSQMEGIGLFRSEFVYMMKKDGFPSEEEQFEIYKEAAILTEGKELTIRTLDIGGDKGLDYFEFAKEENPFLGCRAIRLCLNMPEMFKTQLRALLRASIYGNIRIMYPMLISVEELEEANRLLAECKQELTAEGKEFRDDVEVGMMIETPSSVMMADEFAQRVDFFSIGTNDLTQYLLAVDRGNEAISSLYNSFHPTVLRAINHVIDRAHAHGIKAGMCGEFASNDKASPILLGMGLDEFSMSAGSIKTVKYRLRNTSYEEAQKLAKEVVSKATAKEVLELL